MWTIGAIGRLGNQMGQYATLYALAKLNGHPAYIMPDMHNYLARYFKLNLPVMHKDVIGKIQWRHYGLHDWMEEQYKHIKGDYVKLGTYPCSWTFYHHIRDEILKEFTFHDFIVKEAQSYLRKISNGNKNVTFIGVHVQRGDYVHVMPNIWKGVIGDKAYFEQAMNYFRKKYNNTVFVVTSNGMDWCKKNIDTSRGDVYFSGDGNEATPGNDFAILIHCNHTIMSIGTFGFWAGYLAGGETVYLTNFTLPESEFLRVFKYAAYYLPEWIGIPADLSPLLNKNSAKL
ncbi:galactoside alpha-(1,2)-fucosyltransferase 2-like [Latimeria chalumnae]|uniref:galactoside alpha-(1,2)-fucosyltransferase 2-like n=1 Tax=Latimeria chalumnae TaxID=7897 RepID=UPI00313DECD2